MIGLTQKMFMPHLSQVDLKKKPANWYVFNSKGGSMRKETLLVILFLFCISSNLFAQRTENVFIVVIDGARYTETFGDQTHKYIPKMWNDMRPMGTIYTSFYIDGQTMTSPGHASILTGTWQDIGEDGSKRPDQPTLFEYFRKQHNTSLTDNFVILGKTKLSILSYSNHGEYGSRYGASVKISPDQYQYDDDKTFNNIKDVITTHHPRLVIANFSETDIKGHQVHMGAWNNYVSAIKKADNLISELWTLIQSDSIYRDKTTLFVTNDHGRHTKNFRDHGDNCEGCRHIMLLVVGPDTPKGVVDSETRKQVDIAPTVGQLLKFNTPYCTGSLLNTAIISKIFERSIGNVKHARNFNLPQNYPKPFYAVTTEPTGGN